MYIKKNVFIFNFETLFNFGEVNKSKMTEKDTTELNYENTITFVCYKQIYTLHQQIYNCKGNNSSSIREQEGFQWF